ncbi:MAG: hypothetical protein KC535_00415 [Nanoarchaeota archaeon]|nr:hypothetical protein [Nanoarchaeota archaeon]
MTNKIPKDSLGSPFSKWELTVKETFALDGLYKRIHDFLVEEQWKDLNGGDVDSGGDEFEDYYFQRTQGDMKFHVIWWRATKRPKIHGNKYVQFYLILDMVTQALKDKEVIHNGQKIGLHNGEFKVNAQLFLVDEDPNSPGNAQWNEHPILSFVKKRFWNRENKGVMGACKGELMKFSNDLYELIQRYTGVLPEGPVRDFSPVKGTHN